MAFVRVSTFCPPLQFKIARDNWLYRCVDDVDATLLAWLHRDSASLGHRTSCEDSQQPRAARHTHTRLAHNKNMEVDAPVAPADDAAATPDATDATMAIGRTRPTTQPPPQTRQCKRPTQPRRTRRSSQQRPNGREESRGQRGLRRGKARGSEKARTRRASPR